MTQQILSCWISVGIKALIKFVHSTYKKVRQFKLDQWIDVASKLTIVLSWRLAFKLRVTIICGQKLQEVVRTARCRCTPSK